LRKDPCRSPANSVTYCLLQPPFPETGSYLPDTEYDYLHMDRFPSLIIIAGGPVFDFRIKFLSEIVNKKNLNFILKNGPVLSLNPENK
jgi:hypothetical protein